MIKPPPPKPRGIAGQLFVYCLAAGGLGLGLDLMLDVTRGLSVAEQPGGRAALGVGVAAILVLSAHALRWLLGKPAAKNDEGGARVRDHA